jgi:hypothetical protein
VNADLLRGGAVRGVRGHRRARCIGDPGGIQRVGEAAGEGPVGDGWRVGGQVVVGGAFVAHGRGEQDDVAGFLAGLEASCRADADAARDAELGLGLQLGHGRGRADPEAVHPHPPVRGVDQEESSGTGAEHVIRGVCLGMRGEVQLEVGVGEHHAAGNRASLPAASAQGIEERRRPVGTRVAMLVRHGRERHVHKVPPAGTRQASRASAVSAQCPDLAQRGRTPCQRSCQGRDRGVSGAVPIVVA